MNAEYGIEHFLLWSINMQIICFCESLSIFALTLHILLVLVSITRQKSELISSVIDTEQQQQQKNKSNFNWRAWARGEQVKIHNEKN